MKSTLIYLGILFSIFTSNSILAKDDGFPGRAKFPSTAIYQTSDLLKDFDKVVIVDARSSLEFNTLHIKGAVNISVSNANFGKKVRALRKTTKKPIVFYCNGRTCFKSYKAAQKAHRYRVKNVFAYDAGIFEWAKSNPKYSVLLGKSPIDPNNIISKSKLKAHFLEPKAFAKRVRAASRKDILVLDVRDKLQRDGVGLFTGRERWVGLDDQKKLDKYLLKAISEKRTLYIYDEAGKQVRWLQYSLEKSGIKEYYFMKKGAKQFYKDMVL